MRRVWWGQCCVEYALGRRGDDGKPFGLAKVGRHVLGKAGGSGPKQSDRDEGNRKAAMQRCARRADSPKNTQWTRSRKRLLWLIVEMVAIVGEAKLSLVDTTVEDRSRSGQRRGVER